MGLNESPDRVQFDLLKVGCAFRHQSIDHHRIQQPVGHAIVQVGGLAYLDSLRINAFDPFVEEPDKKSILSSSKGDAGVHMK